MAISVLFFGVLSDVARTDIKIYDGIKSLEELKLRIFDDFPEMVHYDFRFSVNNELVNKDCLVKDGDEVALLPPFAGG
jgi:sulfur-carrier protein